MKRKADILIIGAGSSGIAAAVGASKSGYSVMLIDKHPISGGSSTIAEIGTICGLYHTSSDSKSKFVCNGFPVEFAKRLQYKSKTEPQIQSENLHFLPYKIGAFKELCDELIRENNIDFLSNSVITHVETQDQKLKKIHCLYEDNIAEIDVNCIIDCSGNAIVANLTNHPLIPSDSFQSAAIVCEFSNIKTQNIFSFNLLLIKELNKAILSNNLTLNHKNTFLVPGSYEDGKVRLKLGIELPVSHKQGNLEELKTAGLKQVKELSDYLLKHFEPFEHAELSHVANDIGWRTGFRPIGKHILSEQEIRACMKHDISVANCSWPMEEWFIDKKVQLEKLPENDFYQIHAGCLESSVFENLLFAGKNISATDKGIASARVMGICLQTGFAAGKMAVNYLKNDKSILTSQV